MSKGVDIIKQIVDECMDADLAFTIYDIIPEARARGCKLDKARISSTLFAMRYPIWYTQSNIEIKGVLVEVYHPADINAESYDASDIVDSITSVKKYKGIDRKLDKVLYEKLRLFDTLNDRYTVPSFKVKQAGFNRGDKILLTARKNKIELKQGGNPKKSLTLDRHAYDSIMTVDGHYNIKVHRKHFANAFKDIPNSITVKSNRGIIKILSDNLY